MRSNNNNNYNNNNFSNEYYDNLIVESDEDGDYYIDNYNINFHLYHDEIDNIIDNNINLIEGHTAYEFVENALTGGVTGHKEEIEINLEFTIENELLNIFFEGELIAKIYIGEELPHEPEIFSTPPNNKNKISQAWGYIYLKNIGKRKIRYYKNGNKYVIVKGKKKKIK